MNFHRLGFTLLEIMIVIAIIGILIGAIYPQVSYYYAHSRDVARISHIKDLSAVFQDYSRLYSTYPSTTNANATLTSRCISDIFTWTDALPQFKDKQFSQLGGTGQVLKKDPGNQVFGSNFLCDLPSSYFYNSLGAYGVVAARMELQAGGANYKVINDLLSVSKIDDMVQAKPLDTNDDDPDKIFLIITN